MKKYIKQVSLLALFVAFTSCTDNTNDEISLPPAGGRTILQTTTISRLDTNFEIPLTVSLTDGITATKIEVYNNIANTGAPIKLGDHVATATITDGIKATFNSSGLGDFSKFPVRQQDGSLLTVTRTTGTMPLAFVTTYSDGTQLTTTSTLTVAKGIVWKTLDDDNEPTVTISSSGISEINYLDPAQKTIYYAVVKKSTTTITNVTLEITKNGTSLGINEVNKEKGSRDISKDVTDMGLVIGDKLTYKYVVTSASGQQDNITTTIKIVTQGFEDSKSGAISQDIAMNKFSFETGKNYSDDSKIGEIIFNPDFGFAKAGTTKIEFVENTGLDYDTADLFNAQTAFDDGTPVTVVTGLSIDSVVLYKITRNVNLGTEDEPDFQDVTHYGLLKVTETTHTSTEQIQSFKFDYKEGELLLQE